MTEPQRHAREAELAEEWGDNPLFTALQSPSPASTHPRKNPQDGQVPQNENQNPNTADSIAVTVRQLEKRRSALLARRLQIEAEESRLNVAINSLRAVINARNSPPFKTYEIIQAYIDTLTRGENGTAQIILSDLLRFALDSNWTSPARKRREALMSALAHMAQRGYIKRRGRADYWTIPQ